MIVSRSTSLTVTEIFYSIQGESSLAGLPTVFVRLAGCNLRCVWCDTTYAFHGGMPMRLGEIVGTLRSYPCRRACITGGEPLLQQGVYPLMDVLLSHDYAVSLETGGSLSIAEIPHAVKIIYDIKCPDSGEEARNAWGNLERLRGHDEVKFVIASRKDFAWALRVITQHRLDERCEVLVSPVWENLDVASLAAWILESGRTVRMQLQLHKCIWGRHAQGV